MNISGNTILITGGGSGIGLALTKALVKTGNQVIICGRRRERLEAVKKLLPEVTIRVCDISNKRSSEALINWLKPKFGDLNILINNAGIQRPFDFFQGSKDLENADSEIAINLTAPIHLTAHLVPILKKKKEAAIINISSGLAFTPLALVPIYCATKAAMHSWSYSLRHQLRDTSIKVFEVFPPMVATELHGNRDGEEAGPHIMSAEAVADGIINAMERDQYEIPLGAAVNLREKREALFPMLNQ